MKGCNLLFCAIVMCLIHTKLKVIHGQEYAENRFPKVSDTPIFRGCFLPVFSHTADEFTEVRSDPLPHLSAGGFGRQIGELAFREMRLVLFQMPEKR